MSRLSKSTSQQLFRTASMFVTARCGWLGGPVLRLSCFAVFSLVSVNNTSFGVARLLVLCEGEESSTVLQACVARPNGLGHDPKTARAVPRSSVTPLRHGMRVSLEQVDGTAQFFKLDGSILVRQLQVQRGLGWHDPAFARERAFRTTFLLRSCGLCVVVRVPVGFHTCGLFLTGGAEWHDSRLSCALCCFFEEQHSSRPS